ncbi:winged helix-turn-helix transcriptional regulator [Actinomadura sp. SCN-SB]|uniref:winged helix-turn-helix transcriptional regulator n=1 Tax=Actinomadura sp. SCN-SB TaxID=3373092 RepID=UPI003751E06F
MVPPRVDYALTPLGASLHSTIKALVDWTERHQAEIIAARDAYDARAASAETSSADAGAEAAPIGR